MSPAASRLIVQKYGGTSVAGPERIRAVAERIAARVAAGDRVAVVVSAMGHSTDELIALAHQVSRQPPHREMDMLLSTGERISMALLSMALSEFGVRAVSLTGSQSGIITDSSHRRARIKRVLGDRVRAALGSGQVPIVAGFQGVSENKEITTLGRGGSDTTAVALAAALEADECEIYTDVDGVYSADPRLVPNARLWPELTYEAMIELAYRGAGVLHPRSVELAQRFAVRLSVRSSMNARPGTQIVRVQDLKSTEAVPMETSRIVGVTADESKVLLEVNLARTATLQALWDLSAEQQLLVLSPQFSDLKVQCFIEREAAPEWKLLLDRMTREGFVASSQIKEALVPVSVVGQRFSQDARALGKVMDVLARAEIWVTMGASSSTALTVAVPQNRAAEAVQALHSALVVEKSE